MPQPKNTFLRLLVPAIVIAAGIGITAKYMTKAPKAPPPAAANAPAGGTPQPEAPSAQTPAEKPAAPPAEKPAETAQGPSTPPAAPPPSGPAATGQAPANPAATTGYHVVPAPGGQLLEPLGSLDPKGPYKAQIHFSQTGAGVALLELADQFESIRKSEHVNVQREESVPHTSGPADVLVPFAALAVEISPPGGKGVIVPLTGPDTWRAVAPGRFEAQIADDAGHPVLRLTREFVLAQGESKFDVKQRAENLSGEALNLKYYETGPVDMPQDAIGYGGDKRRVRFGYMLPASKDPTQAQVLSSDYLMPRATALDKRNGRGVFEDKALWPNDKSKENQYALVWTGTSNRYFGVAAYPLATPTATGAEKTLAWVDGVSRVVLDGGAGSEYLGLRLDSKPVMLAAAGKTGATADFSHGVYAGPLDRSEIAKDPLLQSLGLTGLVVYNFGGPCGFCTFEPVSNLLLWILHTLHDRVFQDWSLSIIFLVLIVRTCLHPVTKWSQIKMARFGKQMAAIGPKQKALQEKYKDDPKKLQEETGKLWREEGISPAGFLGCLPMTLQTPVWIALYAALYFSFEMRNYPAFYGVFQHIQPASWKTWQFLGNLAEPDRLLYFNGRILVTLPLLGQITSLNVLPILLAVVFFIQQKYLTPPTPTTTPEQEFQQKMMRWLTVFMFPVFMYNAPSGLAIYFVCNSTFAILESKYIRSHMDKYDMLNVEKMKQQREAKKKGKQAGLLGRLQEIAEEKQKEARKRAGLPPGGPRRKP